MAAYFSTSAIAAIFGGLLSTSFSLFAGFLIKYETLPSFWKFMYWLNPLHYAMEGILMTQYHNDQSLISITTGGGGSMETMTTHEFLVMFFPSWSYANRIGDVLALVIIIVVLK
jgi:ABC-type multidrug transport system permease subunit